MENNTVWATIFKLIMSFIEKKVEAPTPTATPPPAPENSDNRFTWTDPNSMVSKYFSVNNCLLLHNWHRLATTEDGFDPVLLVRLCNKLDKIREILGFPMNIHCIFRSQAYNASQNIKPEKDVHSMSLAADFDCSPNLTIEQIREILLPKLEELGIRMEFGTTSWIHVDLRAPGPSGRHFHV